MFPWRLSRTWFASQPTARRSGERYSAMPSSALRRSPARTFFAMGFNRWSVMVSSLILNPLKISNAPNRCRSAPEQQEQQTNITVHGEKRSVQLAEVAGFDERVLVSQQRRDHGDACPRRPRKPKAVGQPRKKRDNADMHDARDQQRVGNPEALGDGIETGALVVVDVLARIKHIKAADP